MTGLRYRLDNMPAEGLEGVVELVDGATIKLASCNEFVTRLHEGVKD